MPYKNPRDRKPWRERPEARKRTRGFVWLSDRTIRRLDRRARRARVSRHQLADRIVSAILDAVGA
jgi:hypothetical protein